MDFIFYDLFFFFDFFDFFFFEDWRSCFIYIKKEKTMFSFQLDPTQTSLYTYQKRIEASNYRCKKIVGKKIIKT